MASISNSSPSENNTSGTDLSIIHTEDEEQIDTTNWMPAKLKKLQHMVVLQGMPTCFWRKGFNLYHNEEQNYTHESPYA